MKMKGSLTAIIIAFASAWLGAYLGYRYAFQMIEVYNEQRLQREIKAVVYELENHTNMTNLEEARQALKDKYILTGEPFRTDALTHFIESGDYLEVQDVKLIRKLISLNQWYARTNKSGERYSNYTWGIGRAMSNRDQVMWDAGSAWILEMEILKRQLEEVIPLLKKLIKE